MCAYVANEDYVGGRATAPAEERKELDRIHREGYEKHLDMGDVRAYVLSPDGHPYSIVLTGTTAQTLSMLEEGVGHFKPIPGQPVVPPKQQSAPPPSPADAVILHLVSRGDDRGSWGEFPAENWIVLKREEWSKLLPTEEVRPGETWNLDRHVSAKILTYFYPQTENNDARVDRIEEQSLTGKILTIKDGVVTARVDGLVRMHHAFYPGRKNAAPLDAEVVGALTFTPGKPPSILLATTRAVHGIRRFKVAVETVAPSAR